MDTIHFPGHGSIHFPTDSKHTKIAWKIPGGQDPSRKIPGRKNRIFQPGRFQEGCRTPASFLETSRFLKSAKSERMRDDIRSVEQLSSWKLPGKILKTVSFQEASWNESVFRSPKNHGPTLFCRIRLCQPGIFLEASRKLPGTFQEGSRKTRWK